jgi:hypothetical protein
LTEYLFELKEWIVKGMGKSTILTALFQTTIDLMSISIKSTLHVLEQMSENLSQAMTGTNKRERERKHSTLLSSLLGSQMEKMKKCREKLIKSTVDQAGELLIEVEKVHRILQPIDKKLKNTRSTCWTEIKAN